MKNTYAKEYYDTYLKELATDYKSARWFSSPEARLDYKETRRTIEKALGSVEGKRVLEVGPGDGVWTDLWVKAAVSLTLLDQSVEMIARAKERLKDFTHITYENRDFLTYESELPYDLICAIRCFEYFEDKELAMSRFATLLASKGKLIIVTKNPQHAKMRSVQERELHKGQISRSDMIALLDRHGFNVEAVYAATWRFKAKYAFFRGLFNLFHLLHIKTSGAFTVPGATVPLTESYLYVATKR